MKRENVYIGAIGILVIAAAYFFMQSSSITAEVTSKQTAGDIVKDIYDLQFETNSEILKVEDTNGMYKVVVRFTDFTGQQATNDVFVTKDGQLLTDRFIITSNYRDSLAGQKAFVECLSNSGVRILGKSDDTATLQQIQVLGNYAYKLFVSCDGASEQVCSNLGVTRYPTTIHNNTGYDNIYTPEFYTQLTGCEL